MDLGLRGKNALVCASTKGLGRGIAETLAAEGARVVINGRKRSEAEEIAAQLPGSVAVAYDITEDGTGPALVSAAVDALGGDIDIAVLNGPGPKPGAAADMSADEFRAALEMLLIFQQSLVEAVLPGMRERGWGRILAIGSSGVIEPISRLVLSNVGRSALAAYVKTLAGEVARDGVTVNMLLPGRIDTERVRSLDVVTAEHEGRTADDVAAQAAATIPAGRYGTIAEFGAIGAFLCSELAGYITGSAVRCDGGLAHRL